MANNVIVFPTDFSALSLKALPIAQRMASVMDAELHCVYAVEEPHIYATLDMGPVAIPTAEELADLFIRSEVTHHELLDALLRRAGVPEAAIYAMTKTGVFISEHTGITHTDVELAEWNAAIEEFEAALH